MKKKTITIQGFAFIILLFLLAFCPTDGSIFNASTVYAATSDDNQNDIKLNVNSKSLVTDTTYSLKVYNLNDNQKVYFKSESASIASVDKDGLITANNVGDTYITVVIKEGLKTLKTLRCDITVGPPAKSITLTKHDLKITVDKKRYLKVILIPNNTVEEAFFFSSDESVCTVDSNGKVTGVSEGVAYIYATIDNKSYDVCKVKVIKDNVDEAD